MLCGHSFTWKTPFWLSPKQEISRTRPAKRMCVFWFRFWCRRCHAIIIQKNKLPNHMYIKQCLVSTFTHLSAWVLLVHLPHVLHVAGTIWNFDIPFCLRVNNSLWHFFQHYFIHLPFIYDLRSNLFKVIVALHLRLCENHLKHSPRLANVVKAE